MAKGGGGYQEQASKVASRVVQAVEQVSTEDRKQIEERAQEVVSKGQEYAASPRVQEIKQNVSQAAGKGKAAAMSASRELQAYLRVKHKSWQELTSQELQFAESNGITNEMIYEAWKAKQAAIYAQMQGRKSTAEEAVAALSSGSPVVEAVRSRATASGKTSK